MRKAKPRLEYIYQRKSKQLEIEIRTAKREDATAIHALVHELAVFEKEPESHSCTVLEYEEDGFSNRAFFNTILACHGEKVVGMAMYFFGYSSWKGKMLYLDDLVVTESYRSKGIGSRLIKRLFAIAEQNQVKRIKWQVLDWNKEAIKLYEKFNMDIDDGWLNCSYDLN